jgi:hypothetical protein
MSSGVASERPAQQSVPGAFVHLARRLGWLASERGAYVVLGIAMAASAGVILSLNRGTTFYVDELYFFTTSPELGLREVLEPSNGHLLATFRVYVKLLLEAFGAGYLAFRILHVGVLLLAAGLFFALAKRRIGAVAALAPTLVLLFLGSDWQHVVVPVGTPVVLSIAAGLAAVLALERDDLIGDAAACGLVCVAIATFSVGLAFLVGVAVSVLIRPDRRRRAWVFLVPLLLYGGWWVWAAGVFETTSTEQTKASNVLLIPNYVADSAATVAAAVSGLAYNFSSPPRPDLEIGWGRLVAIAAVAGLVWRVRRGGVPTSLWASVAILLAYWVIGALAVGTLGRVPTLVKYVYPGSVAALLVATDAAWGVRFSRLGLAALFGAVAVSLATNIALLRDGGAYFRDTYSDPVRAQLAMVELARDEVSPDFNPFTAVPEAAPDAITLHTGPYLEAVDRFGSPAFTLSELQRQDDPVRHTADLVLARATGLRLEPARAGSAAVCRTVQPPAPGEGVTVDLPPGTTTLTADAYSPAGVQLKRFAQLATVPIGELSPGEAVELSIPPDTASRPWQASVSPVRSLRVCA